VPNENEFDPRVVSISIEAGPEIYTYKTESKVGAAGQVLSSNGLYMTATGTKFANSLQNECTIVIANLKQSTCNLILTEASPMNPNRVPKRVIVNAGRNSSGLALLYSGEILAATISQPPDRMLTIRCLTMNFGKGDIIINESPGSILLSTLSKQVADSLKISLNFQAKDRQISSYSYTGSATKQVDRINSMGNVSAYVDNNVLVVKDYAAVIKNQQIRLVSSEFGLIGIPELNEFGVKFTMFLDNHTTLGSLIRLKSKLNPAANGDYLVYKLSFSISTRDKPFYWIVEAQNTHALQY
jgi:hypothetical protein